MDATPERLRYPAARCSVSSLWLTPKGRGSMAPFMRTWVTHSPAPACSISRCVLWVTHGMSWSISVNFAPENDRSVTTLEAFESPATAQRNPIAGGWPVASMDDHDGDAVTPRHDRPVRSRERNLEVPFPCFAVRSTGLLCAPRQGYAGGCAKRPRSAREATIDYGVFPCALMDNPEHPGVPITPLPRPQVTRGTTHQGASVRRPAATGTIGRHRRHARDWYGPPLRHPHSALPPARLRAEPPIRMQISAHGGDRHAVYKGNNRIGYFPCSSSTRYALPRVYLC